MRKSVALLLTAAMAAGLVSGCGTSTGSQSPATTEAGDSSFVYTGEAPITDKEGQSVSILGQNSNYSTVDIKAAPIVQKVYTDAGITIDWTLVDPTNYSDAVGPMLAAGTDLPDIVLLPDKDENMTYINSGIFVALDEYFDYMPNYKKWLDENPTIRASLTAPDGHIYYVPGINVPYNYQPTLMYNMKWMRDAGFEKAPSTLDEFTEMLRYFKDNDMNGNGDATDEIPLSVQKQFLTYMFGPAFGLNFNDSALKSFYADENGGVHYAYYEDSYKDYLTYLHNMYEEGLLELEYTTLTRDQIVERFAQDKTGVSYDYGYQMSMTFSPQLPYYDGTAENGVCGVPPLSGPEEGFYVARVPLGNMFGVNKNAKDLLLAIKFLDYTVNNDNQEMYVWGIEGESFEYAADGSKQFTEKGKDSNWLQSFGINPSFVYPARQSVEATDVLVADWHADVDKTLEQYMQDPWPFIYATTEESSIISQYMVDIQTYVEEMMVSFISGVTPLDQFDTYISTLKSMNMDEILKIKSEQYERYQNALNQK